MIRSVFTKNIVLKLASLFIAAMLWMFVIPQSEKPVDTEFTVPVKFINQSSRFIRVQPEETEKRVIDVIVTGPRKLDKSEQEEFYAVVDLTGCKPSDLPVAREVVLVTPSPFDGTEWTHSTKQKKVAVRLDIVDEREVDVVLRASGLAPSEYTYGGSTLSPKTVRVRGAKEYVSLVRQVRAVLDLSKTAPSGDYLVELEALDDAGLPITGVVFDPPKVTVRPSLMVAPSAKYVLITPRFKGSLAAGYTISHVTINPNQIQVKGKSEVIASLSSVETEPIDVQDLDGTRTYTVRVMLPSGLILAGNGSEPLRETTVQVELKVDKVR